MELVQSTSQTTTATGTNILFQNIVVPASKCMSYNSSTGVVTLKGLCNNQSYARFRVTYSGTIAANATTTEAIIIAAVNGSSVASTVMEAMSADSGDSYTVSRTFYVMVPKCSTATLSIQSSTSSSETISNSILIVDRVA